MANSWKAAKIIIIPISCYGSLCTLCPFKFFNSKCCVTLMFWVCCFFCSSPWSIRLDGSFYFDNRFAILSLLFRLITFPLTPKQRWGPSYLQVDCWHPVNCHRCEICKYVLEQSSNAISQPHIQMLAWSYTQLGLMKSLLAMESNWLCMHN